MAYLKKQTNRVGKTYYYSQVFYDGVLKPFTISLSTTDYKIAMERHEEIEDKEKAIKQGMKFIWSWKSDKRKTRILKSTLRSLVSKFIDMKKVNTREGTWKRYRISLNAFMNAVGEGISPTSINNETIEYFKKFYNGVHKVGGININLRGIKCFLKWAFEEGHINKMPKVRQLKIDKSKPKIINDANWDRLMKLDSLTDYWKDLFTLYRNTGMRRAEGIYGVLNGSFLKIGAEHTKSRKDKDIKLTIEQIEIIKTIHLARDKYLEKGYTLENFLNNICKQFRKATSELGLDLTFHSLRHTFATRRYFETRDIYQVRNELGHQKTSTTEIYADWFRNLDILAQEFPSLVKQPIELKVLETQNLETQAYY